MISNQAEIKSELYGLLGESHALQAEDVVTFAKNHPASSVRAAFDKLSLFDDSVAAEVARRQFARSLIQRVRIRFIRPDKEPVPIRVFVNLTEERTTIDRGYRLRSTVMEDTHREAMLRRDFSRAVETLLVRFADVLGSEQVALLRDVAADVSGVSVVS